MRQFQKTEIQADHLSSIDLKNQEYTKAWSTDYGKGRDMSVIIQDSVLDCNNLNQAYLRGKINKVAKTILKLITSIHDGSYSSVPVKRVEIPKLNGRLRKLGISIV